MYNVFGFELMRLNVDVDQPLPVFVYKNKVKDITQCCLVHTKESFKDTKELKQTEGKHTQIPNCNFSFIHTNQRTKPVFNLNEILNACMFAISLITLPVNAKRALACFKFWYPC